MPEIKIQIPYAPRPLQAHVHKSMATKRFAVAVCHRRFGKTVLAVNELIKSAMTCSQPRPRLAYVGPTYRQAKATAWDYLQYYSRPIPGIKINQQELRIDYPNGGQVRLYGADNPDSLRGIYLDGVVLDEYGMQPAKTWGEVIRPSLSDRQGWAMFLGTPNGKNQFWDMAQYAHGADDWAYFEFRASTTGYVLKEELEAARRVMTQDEYAQEFECSFSASVRGAIYASELEIVRSDGRITRVAYDPALPVDTDWDLGVLDATAIIFSQSTRSGEVRIIDYEESSGEGLPYYARLLQQKPYAYGAHWAPHDIQVRELGSGKSRIETAAALGIRFRVAPRLMGSVIGEVEEGIAAARLILPRCWFDAEKTKSLVEALMSYRREYNTRTGQFRATPHHDEYSHAADAFRGLAVRQRVPVDAKPSQKPSFVPEWAWG